MAMTPAVTLWRAPICFEDVGYGQVAGEERLLVVFRVAAEVVFGEGGDALFGHGSGEQAGVHGGVVDDADVVLAGRREGFRPRRCD